jgi:hypothetical protein
MTTTINRVLAVGTDPAECARLSRSVEARHCYPGVERVQVRANGLVLFFEIKLAPPGADAAGAPVVWVDEHLGPAVDIPGGIRWTSTMLWKWPNEELVSADSSYTFRVSEAGTEFTFELSYEEPQTRGLAQLLDRGRFGQSVERALERYLEHLTALLSHATVALHGKAGSR